VLRLVGDACGEPEVESAAAGPDSAELSERGTPADLSGRATGPDSTIDGSDATCFVQTDRRTLQTPRNWGVVVEARLLRA